MCSGTVSPQPPTGNQPRFTAKMRIRTRPTQNDGMPSPTRGTARMTWSVRPVLADGRDGRQRDGDQDAEERGDGDQRHRDADAAGDQRAGGHVIEERRAGVAVRQLLEEQPELDPDRLVQPPARAQRVDLLRRAAVAEQGHGRVARDQAQQEERDDGDAEDDRDGLSQAAEHVHPPALRPSRRQRNASRQPDTLQHVRAGRVDGEAVHRVARWRRSTAGRSARTYGASCATIAWICVYISPRLAESISAAASRTSLTTSGLL